MRQPTPDVMGDLLGPIAKTEMVTVSNIRMDGGTQMRAGLDEQTLADYAEKFTGHHAWGDFPPVVLYYDGADYWVGDGFHRITAYQNAVIGSNPNAAIPADVRSGTRRDAILHAAGANSGHGLRRTNADKRRSVEVMLNDEEWRQWSDGNIAQRCAVSDRFVAAMRKELTPNGSESTTRTGADGRTINTANIGITRSLAVGASAPMMTVGELEAFILDRLEIAVGGDPARQREFLTRSSITLKYWQQELDYFGRRYRAADIETAKADAHITLNNRIDSRQPVASADAEITPTNGKPLVDWNDTDWDAYHAGRLAQQRAHEDAAHHAATEAKARRNGMTKAEYATWLAPQVAEWLFAYTDKHGRTWQTIVDVAAHSNSQCWQDITAEFNRRGIHWDDETLKDAIHEAFDILRADADEEAALPVTPALAATIEAEPDEAIVKPVPVSKKDGYESDEWYTPERYIDAARAVMGGIDLDPASCELAQTVVKADVYIDKLQNGLSIRWIRERIWLNPPYGDASPWMNKLIAEYDDGHFLKQAIVLLNNNTETGYFQALLARFPVCRLNQRIQFWRHDQSGETARQGQAIFYLGADVDRFVEVFGQFGPILRRIA